MAIVVAMRVVRPCKKSHSSQLCPHACILVALPRVTNTRFSGLGLATMGKTYPAATNRTCASVLCPHKNRATACTTTRFSGLGLATVGKTYPAATNRNYASVL